MDKYSFLTNPLDLILVTMHLSDWDAYMSTHNTCFCKEIRKISNLDWKKKKNLSRA